MDDTKRKQLEAAAMAAGYRPLRLTDDGTALLLEGIQQPWNPRDENPHSDSMGDALRLAVKLKLGIHFEDQFLQGKTIPIVEVFYNRDEEAGKCSVEMHSLDDDPQATVRRCIVRTAAAIGQGMREA